MSTVLPAIINVGKLYVAFTYISLRKVVHTTNLLIQLAFPCI